MIAFLVLLSAAYVAADPIIVGVQNQPEFVEDGGYIGRPVYSSFYPSNNYGHGYYVPQQQQQQHYHHHHQMPAKGYIIAQQPMGVMERQPYLAQTAVVQQQSVGVVQNQASGPTQIYKPAQSPPMVVNPAPVIVRPPPPPPIYVQPQKIFVQPPQVPPVYASNPQVYYAQQNCPGCGGQPAGAQMAPQMAQTTK